MPTDGASRPAKLEGAAELRERALVMLAAIERAEPRPLWDQLREVVTGATRVGDLRTVLRELRAMVGALSSDARRELARELRVRFGPDPEEARDLKVVERVRARGRIRSEPEYRAVESYADSIAGDAERQEEFLALGALLDEFSASP
jgi:hypothetical protein